MQRKRKKKREKARVEQGIVKREIKRKREGTCFLFFFLFFYAGLSCPLCALHPGTKDSSLKRGVASEEEKKVKTHIKKVESRSKEKVDRNPQEQWELRRESKEDNLELVVGVSGNLLLGGTTSRLVVDAVTGGLNVLLAAVEVDDGDALAGQLAAGGLAGQLDIGTVVVVLGEDVGGPAPDEQASLLLAGRSVLGDLNGPLVVGIGASLGVGGDQVVGLSVVVRERELAGTATVASLGELLAGAGGLGLGLDLASLHGRGQETDRDNLTSLQLGDGARSVSTAGETLGPLAILVANEGVDAAVVLLSTVASTGGGVEQGHVCGGRSDHRNEDNETSSNLHDDFFKEEE